MKILALFLLVVFCNGLFAQELRMGSLDKASVQRIRKKALLKILVHTKENGENVTFRGTGFFVSKRGHFLTNLHVISPLFESKEKTEIEFLTPNGDRLENVSIIKCGDERRADICYLQAKKYKPKAWFPIDQGNIIQTKITFYSFGNSEKDFGIKSGKFVKHWLDVGGFFGFGRQRWNKAVKTFETTIPLERGDSGGPLFDHLGRVIGMTCSYYKGRQDGKRHNIAISIGELVDFVKKAKGQAGKKIDKKRFKKVVLENLYGDI